MRSVLHSEGRFSEVSLSNITSFVLLPVAYYLMILPLAPSSSDVGPTVPVKSPTLRAVGLTVLMNRPPEASEETCILCQADSKDAAVQDKVFVQAVCVQRSCVLRRQSSTECTPADVKELGTSEGNDIHRLSLYSTVFFFFFFFF